MTLDAIERDMKRIAGECREAMGGEGRDEAAACGSGRDAKRVGQILTEIARRCEDALVLVRILQLGPAAMEAATLPKDGLREAAGVVGVMFGVILQGGTVPRPDAYAALMKLRDALKREGAE